MNPSDNQHHAEPPPPPAATTFAEETKANLEAGGYSLSHPTSDFVKFGDLPQPKSYSQKHQLDYSYANKFENRLPDLACVVAEDVLDAAVTCAHRNKENKILAFCMLVPSGAASSSSSSFQDELRVRTSWSKQVDPWLQSREAESINDNRFVAQDVAVFREGAALKYDRFPAPVAISLACIRHPRLDSSPSHSIPESLLQLFFRM